MDLEPPVVWTAFADALLEVKVVPWTFLVPSLRILSPSPTTTTTKVLAVVYVFDWTLDRGG